MDDLRIGHGHDRHKLSQGEELVLAGVTIDHELGTIANSDGDVIVHSLIDALLGALGENDIGTHFPDNTEQWTGTSSMMFLDEVTGMLNTRNWSVINVDITVFLEEIKLSNYRDQFRRNISETLPGNNTTNVKFTTGEGLGPVGRGEAIESECVVLLREK